MCIHYVTMSLNAFAGKKNIIVNQTHTRNIKHRGICQRPFQDETMMMKMLTMQVVLISRCVYCSSVKSSDQKERNLQIYVPCSVNLDNPFIVTGSEKIST